MREPIFQPPSRLDSASSARAAFTLIEVLVVIAIIAILAGLLLPALIGSKERARRAACKNQVRQFLLTLQLYADDHRDFLPSGLSDMGVDEHTPVLSTLTRSNLVKYGGSARILDCPSLGEPFNPNKAWFEGGYGFVIGYNYLGGHTNTPWPVTAPGFSSWTSPQKTTQPVIQPLVADLNDWSPGYRKTFAPHGANGPILKDRRLGFDNDGAGGVNPQTIGSVGGNVGSMDGSVAWKAIARMNKYHGSFLWGNEGCYAMW